MTVLSVFKFFHWFNKIAKKITFSPVEFYFPNCQKSVKILNNIDYFTNHTDNVNINISNIIFGGFDDIKHEKVIFFESLFRSYSLNVIESS